MKQRFQFLPGWLLLIVLVGTLAIPVMPVAAASGTVDPPVGAPGALFTFRAEGFIPRERVDVWVTRPDATPITPSLARYQADDAGQVTWTWAAPGDITNGTWVMVALGVDSDIRIAIPFQIEGTPVDVPGPPISVTPSSGLPGTTFVFVVGGFLPNEQVGAWIVRPDGSTVSLEDENQRVNLYADERGFATWNWTTPIDAPVGWWSSQARGNSSNIQIGAPFEVVSPADPLPPPAYDVTPTSGLPGTVFSFIAGGFLPGEEVGSWLNPPGGGNVDATSYMVADIETGVVTWTYASPGDAQPGMWRMIARGDQSGREVVFTFEILGAAPPPPAPAAQRVDPPGGPQGQTFSFYAEGFQPFESIHYWVTDPNGKPDPNSKQEEASGEGIARWEWESPVDAQPGQWMMSVRGGVTRTEYQITFMIERPDYLPPETGVVPSTGSPGTDFRFAATGYNGSEYIAWWLEGPNDTFIDGTIRQVQSNSDGYVTWEWRAPDDIVAGPWRMFAKGIDSLHLQSIDFTIVRDTPPPPPPDFGVTPASGPPGTTFAFFAEGYMDREVVGYWLNDPYGNVVRLDQEVVATGQGLIEWIWTAPPDALRGQWQMVARSTGIRYGSGSPTKNDKMVIIPFTVE